METYFQIRYEFDREDVLAAIQRLVQEKRTGFIGVADGNVLSHVHSDASFRDTMNKSLFSICDSSWVPFYLKRLYGIHRSQYSGAEIFKDIVSSGAYRMAFLGTNEETLKHLRQKIQQWNPGVLSMPFRALPFCDVGKFDYPRIAEDMEREKADIIWVALGAPKQERFMENLSRYLTRGIMLGVGAAFNFYSGHVRRAPQALVQLRLEFLWRLLTEPGKQFRRCFGIIRNLPGILRQELRHSHRI